MQINLNATKIWVKVIHNRFCYSWDTMLVVYPWSLWIELNISTIWLFAVKNFPNDCLGIFDPGTRDPGLGPYDTIAFHPHDPSLVPWGTITFDPDIHNPSLVPWGTIIPILIAQWMNLTPSLEKGQVTGS